MGSIPITHSIYAVPDSRTIIDQIVEQRIAEAIERGDFDDVPGAGRPLELDDDRLVPQELRVAHRLLKNSGCVPEELQLFAEIRSAEQLLMHARGEEERLARVST